MENAGSSKLNNNYMQRKGIFMAQTGLFCSCTRLTHVVVLASLLILAALCIAQDANQNPATKSVITLDEKGEPIVTQVPADANQVAPVAPAAEAPSSEVTTPSASCHVRW